MTKLTPAMQKFILHWGEMGSIWGVNRTVAQIHAVLYLSPEPMTAEEISETLVIARSTVSTGLRELQNWGIVKSTHVLGDRRDFFEAVSDVWEMFRAILRERMSREVDPTLAMLQESVTQLGADEQEEHVRERLQEMLEVYQSISSIYQQAEQIPTSTLIKIAKLGDNFGKVLSMFVKE